MNRTVNLVSCLTGGALLAMTIPGLAHAVDAKVFDTPDAAAAAMVTALEKGTDAAIVELLAMPTMTSFSPTMRRPSARTASAHSTRPKSR
jgi:hypothetical protein